MKTKYRGHTINAERDASMMGDQMIYFWVVRDEDGYVIEDSSTYAEDTSVREVISGMKERVDAEIVHWDKMRSRAKRFSSLAIKRYDSASDKDLAIKNVFAYFRRNQKNAELLGIVLKSLPIDTMETQFVVTFGMASAAYMRNHSERHDFCDRVLRHFDDIGMDKVQVRGIFKK